MIGAAVVNQDLHHRCTQFITVLESFFLKEDEENKMAHKTTARIAKFLTSDHKQKEEIKEVLETIYDVRHKMIHKAIRKDIDLLKLAFLQGMTVEILLRLIKLNLEDNYSNKNRLINELNALVS
jgi:ribosomal protein L23